MLATVNTMSNSRISEDQRQRENEAFAEAIKNCDAETLEKITSILIEAGSLHE